MNNIVLVDFDGVILRNSQAHSYIKQRVNTFVKRTCRVGHDKKGLDLLNKQWYDTYGHTVLGMRKHGFPVTHKGFNEYVYEDFFKIKQLKMTPEELASWRRFKDSMREMDLHVKIFSNASSIWVKHFLHNEDDETHIFEIQNKMDKYIHENIYNSLLKPDRSMYDMVMQMYPRKIYYFIDDKINNFGPVACDPRWIKIWMNGCGETSWHVKKTSTNSSFFAVHDLVNCGDLIASLERNTTAS